MQLLVAVALILSILFYPVKSFGAFTSLNIIPVADVIPSGGYAIGFKENAFLPNAAVPAVPGQTVLFLSEFGLFPGMELGTDVNLTHGSLHPAYVNFKYQFLQNETETLPILAIGFRDYNGILGTPSVYLIISKELVFGRGHLGVNFPSATPRLDFINTKVEYLVGFNQEVNNWLSLYLDYTSGDANFHSAGFSLHPWKNVELLLTYKRANNQAIASDGYSIHILVTDSFLPGSK